MQEHFLVGAPRTLQDIHQGLGSIFNWIHHHSF
jgi:hypothetical protein